MTTADPSPLLAEAETLHNQGRTREATKLYRHLAADYPDTPQAAKALTNLGVILHQQGDGAQALKLHQQAIAKAPALAEAWCNRGDLYCDLGKLADAEADFRQACSLAPDLAPAWFNLGNVRMRLGRAAEAEECYGQAARLLPDLAGVQAQLARCMASQSRPAEAAVVMAAACRLAPGDWRLLNELGTMQQQADRFSAARDAFRAAIAARPSFAPAHYNLGNALFAAGAATEAAACWKMAWEIDPRLVEAASNHLNGLHYVPGLSGEQIAQTHWRVMERRRYAQPTAYANRPDCHRALRVGYVSSALRRHPVGHLLTPVIRHHRPDSVFAACYSTNRTGDEVTDRLRAGAGLWRDCADLDDEALARLIREDGMDIVVDLDGHTAGGRPGLFARKPAPVQVSWLGYPFTTGTPAMDYVLMDRATVPPEAEIWFREKVALLPGARFCYQGPTDPPPAPPACLTRGHVTFGSFNNIAKLNPDVIAAWSRILQRVAGSRLLLKWPHLRSEEVRRRLADAFALNGIEHARVEMRGDSAPTRLLAEYAEVDIALDPFPYSGAFTSCEALWMGVPVVTLPGPRPFSRQTLALLEAMGATSGLVAGSVAEYEDLAVSLAGQPDRLADLRTSLRAGMDRHLGDGPAHVAALEAFYRDAWEKWCQRANAAL